MDELDPDLDVLANLLIPFAKQQLAKYGTFLPFAAAITSSGDVSAEAAMPDSDTTDPWVVRALLEEGLTAAARSAAIRSCGICQRVELIADDWDGYAAAVALTFERNDGTALTVLTPYRARLLMRPKYGSLKIRRSTPRIFTPNQDATDA